ncbi:MAG: hypothetical protein J5J06_13080 [Phycisphaerae bacterium]|nr:hypothetical protein [Phycisphaerae bacterium]
MARKKNPDNENAGDSNARLDTSAEDKAKARKWFARGRELGEKKQFDYAVEYYVNGLEFWPDAVEEACKPLHGCAVARRQLGGKKPGFKDSMKRSMSDKNPRQAFVNALWLFGHEPDNVSYIEGVVRNASKLRADDTALWAANVHLKALENNTKASGKQFQALAAAMEEVGDRAAAREETKFAVECYQIGVNALSAWRRRSPRDGDAELRLRDLSTKLTITRGKYKDGESFRESIADDEAQKDLQDRQKSVQSADRVEQLIEKAQAEYRESPDDAGVLNRLVDLLTRQEKDDLEKQAMIVLMDAYKRSNDYRRKMQADDVRMRQLSRRARIAAKSGDAEAAKEAKFTSLKYDLAVFRERVEKYPTDNRYKFEYAVRLLHAGKYDDAIPLFQAARNDPKNRAACGMYLGLCFYSKKYYSQAISTLKAELESYEFSDDDLAKSMLYWLGRSEEDAGDVPAARETYGRLLQVDYNYKDVRERLDALPGS